MEVPFNQSFHSNYSNQIKVVFTVCLSHWEVRVDGSDLQSIPRATEK